MNEAIRESSLNNGRNPTGTRPSRLVLPRGGVQRRGVQRRVPQNASQIPTLAMDFSQYTQRPANTGFARMHRSHVEIRELPVLADRVVPVQSTHHKIQFSPEQVDEFVQSLPRMKNSSLGEEERICSICAFEYGDVRGILAAPVSGKGKNLIMSYSDLVDDEGLPGEELPEAAVKLPCGHVYGDWCIKTWLLEQPATCPACRYCFQPV